MDQYFNFFGYPGAVVLSVLMSVFALFLAAIYRKWDRTLCCLAMFCSTIGDMYNSNFQLLTDFTYADAMVIGAVFFMFAHLLYIGAFLYQIKKNRQKLLNPGFFTGAVIFGISLIVFIVLAAHNSKLESSMLILGLIYLCIISINCATIFSLAYTRRGWKWIGAVGALSFFFSDFILGISMIGGIYNASLFDLNWWFYPIGQIGILIAG